MSVKFFEKGSLHWKHQRLTAVMLMFLLVFFLSAIVVHQRSSYYEIVAWIHRPFIAALLIITLLSLFYHSFLGIKMVVEDYVHTVPLRRAVLFASFVMHLFLGVLSIILVMFI